MTRYTGPIFGIGLCLLIVWFVTYPLYDWGLAATRVWFGG